MKRILIFATTLLLTLVAQAAGEVVTIPEGVEPEEYTLTITHAVSQLDGSTIDYNKSITANVAFDGNDVYVQGLAYWFPNAYIKGTLADGKVTFAYGQVMGRDMYGDEYLVGYTLDAEGKAEVADMVFIYDAETRTLTNDPNVIIAEVGEPQDGQFPIYCYVRKAEFTPGGLPPLMPVTVPENLTTETYLLSGTTIYSEQDNEGNSHLTEEKCERPINVGFDGDNLYVQGLVEQVPEGWVMATKNSKGQYVVPAGQYVGTFQAFNLTFDYFVTSLSRNNAMIDVVFTYNEADGSIACTQTMAMTSSATVADCYYWLTGVKMKKVTEKEATPATPEFTFSVEISPYAGTSWYRADYFIPLSDVNGDPMVSDKLSFTFLKEKNGEVSPVTFPAGSSYYYTLTEDLTEIPYGFITLPDIGLHTIYFEKLGASELKSWTRLGLQSTYRGQGVEHKSDIFWFDMTEFWASQGIADIIDTDNMKVAESYDLQGRKIDGTSKGLVIRRIVKADGTTQTVKYMNR